MNQCKNKWTTYLDGKEIAVHNDEKKAYNYEKRKAFELAVQKKWGKSNLETLCSADEERFIIVETPEYDFGKYTINIKSNPIRCVGVCQTREEAEKHKVWCEIHHWSLG